MLVDIKVTGDKTVVARIDAMSLRARDLRGAWRLVWDFLREETEEQFDTHGSHQPGGWPPVSEDWFWFKVRNGFDLRTMHMTLRLRKSLTLRGYKGQIFRSFPDRMQFGTEAKNEKGVVYAMFHQDPKPGSRLPRRAPLYINQTASTKIAGIIEGYVKGSV